MYIVSPVRIWFNLHFALVWPSLGKIVRCEPSDIPRWGWKVQLSVLSDAEIEKRLKEKSLVLSPFDAGCLNGAGYDLRLAMDTTIPAGKQQLVATLERVELPDDLVGTLHIRSSLARAGIVASLALVDPGFRGQLTISLYNAGTEPFRMSKSDRFVQMALHSLSMKTQRPYRGKYQDSQGIVDSSREGHHSLCQDVSKVLLPLSMGM
jgi:dCTP deaminase